MSDHFLFRIMHLLCCLKFMSFHPLQFRIRVFLKNCFYTCTELLEEITIADPFKSGGSLRKTCGRGIQMYRTNYHHTEDWESHKLPAHCAYNWNCRTVQEILPMACICPPLWYEMTHLIKHFQEMKAKAADRKSFNDRFPKCQCLIWKMKIITTVWEGTAFMPLL